MKLALALTAGTAAAFVALLSKAKRPVVGAVQGVLDFVAGMIDKVLGLIQCLYSGILTVIGMIVSGEIAELLRRIGYLGQAAGAA